MPHTSSSGNNDIASTSRSALTQPSSAGNATVSPAEGEESDEDFIPEDLFPTEVQNRSEAEAANTNTTKRGTAFKQTNANGSYVIYVAVGRNIGGQSEADRTLYTQRFEVTA